MHKRQTSNISRKRIEFLKLRSGFIIVVLYYIGSPVIFCFSPETSSEFLHRITRKPLVIILTNSDWRKMSIIIITLHFYL